MKEVFYTANRLALLAKLDRRAIERKLIAVTPAKIEGKARHYRLADVLPALCREPEDAPAEARMRALKEREQNARTESEEMDALAKAGKICLMSAAKVFASENRIAMRQVIEGADFINDAQRKKLLAKIAAVRVEMPDAEPSV